MGTKREGGARRSFSPMRLFDGCVVFAVALMLWFPVGIGEWLFPSPPDPDICRFACQGNLQKLYGWLLSQSHREGLAIQEVDSADFYRLCGSFVQTQDPARLVDLYFCPLLHRRDRRVEAYRDDPARWRRAMVRDPGSATSYRPPTPAILAPLSPQVRSDILCCCTHHPGSVVVLLRNGQVMALEVP